MSKLFYDHLIRIDEILVVLDEQDISDEEREAILSTIDETLHHHVLDVILTHLPHEHHDEFLKMLTDYPHSPIVLEYIQERTEPDMEHEIRASIVDLLNELVQELQDTDDSEFEEN